MRWMHRISALLCCLALLSISARAQEPTHAPAASKFDEFGAIPCGDELARLDSLAHELRADLQLIAYIVVYGRQRGRLDEPVGRALRMATYLIKRRGFDPSRIIAVRAGAATRFKGEFWLVARGGRAPVEESVLRSGKIKLPKNWSRMTDCEDSYNARHAPNQFFPQASGAIGDIAQSPRLRL